VTAADVHYAHLPGTPVGPVTVWVSSTGVRHIEFGPLPSTSNPDPPESRPELLRRVVGQLEEYFGGERRSFALPLDLHGVTDFQRQVYACLQDIRFGNLTTYGDLAQAVGSPQGAQAVGQAVGANPIPIVIPCHRVVTSDGRLGGFSGGLPAKVALLGIEGVEVAGTQPTSRVRPEIIRLPL